MRFPSASRSFGSIYLFCVHVWVKIKNRQACLLHDALRVQIVFVYGGSSGIVKVNANGTSQYCSQSLNRVSKTLSDRWHDCNNCNLSCDRDYNSALLIKKLAVGSSQDKTLPSLKDLVS